jgi:hypothetical protein
MRVMLAVSVCSLMLAQTAATAPRDLTLRAVRTIWNAELARISEAAQPDEKCRVVDVARVEAAAKFLDSLSRLKVARNIHWEYVPLDKTELKNAQARWQQWFEVNGSGLQLDDVVCAAELAAAPHPPETP